MDKIAPGRRSANMRAIRGKNTTPELAVRMMLRGMGFSGYRLHRWQRGPNEQVRGLHGVRSRWTTTDFAMLGIRRVWRQIGQAPLQGP